MPSQQKYFFRSASPAAVGSPPCWWPRESCCWLGRGSAQSKLEPRPQCSPLLDLGRGESGQCLRPSVFDAVQSFFGGGVAVGQGQGGAEFGGGACAVALLFEQLSEHGVGFEGWAGFDGGLQVAAQQAHRERIVAAGAEKHAGAVHERIGAVERAGLHCGESLLHLVEAVGATKKDGEVQPRAGAAVGGVDGGAVFALGGGVVFGALGEAGGDPVGGGGIQARDGFRLGMRFVFASADDAGGFEIKLSEIGAGGQV